MHTIWLFVILSSTFAPSGEPPSQSPSVGLPPAEIMRQLAAMDAFNRQAWADKVFQRLHRACLVVLKGAEVARYYAYNKRMVEIVVENGPDANKALEVLLKELDQVEPLALDRLAAQFRAHINLALSDNAAEQEKRRTALENALSGWKEVGNPPSQRGELLYWILQADRNTVIGYIRPLPEIPRFRREGAAADASTPASGPASGSTTPPKSETPPKSDTPAKSDAPAKTSP